VRTWRCPAGDEGRGAQVVQDIRAAQLRHPGIITVHDVVEEDGRPWIVMELLSGRSLEQADPMPPERAARVGLEVLSALRAAHAQGVLHRDVKPANIFQRDDGRIVLTDFGIASLDGDASLTRTGALMGSPAFMAPERARGEPGGPESDLWSLGITLYALVERRTPFSRETVMGTLSAVLTAPPAPPRSAGPLAPVLLALLTKDPPAQPFRDLRGLGDQAYLHESPDPAGGDAAVVLRLSNVIVEVRHGTRGARNAQDGLRSGALQLARWAVAALVVNGRK
jgi:serine/threonine protein kinase